MDLTPQMCDLIKQTAQNFPLGAARRCFIAQTIASLHLSHRSASRAFGWARDTIRKAVWERHTAQTPRDHFQRRGRKRAEFHLPQLLEDIKDLVRDHLQTDPTFATTRLYCRLSAGEVRRQLISRKGYTDEQLPTIKTITDKLNGLGFRLRKVAKCRPQKK
jgi:hypothetical protein